MFPEPFNMFLPRFRLRILAISSCVSCGSFASSLRNHLASLGFDSKLFAGHSLRRGGASFAYQRDVPIELFKALGEWHSDTILIYLTMPLTGRFHSAYML